MLFLLALPGQCPDHGFPVTWCLSACRVTMGLKSEMFAQKPHHLFKITLIKSIKTPTFSTSISSLILRNLVMPLKINTAIIFFCYPECWVLDFVTLWLLVVVGAPHAIFDKDLNFVSFQPKNRAHRTDVLPFICEKAHPKLLFFIQKHFPLCFYYICNTYFPSWSHP